MLFSLVREGVIVFKILFNGIAREVKLTRNFTDIFTLYEMAGTNFINGFHANHPSNPHSKMREYDTKLGWSKLDAVLPYKVVIFAR